MKFLSENRPNNVCALNDAEFNELVNFAQKLADFIPFAKRILDRGAVEKLEKIDKDLTLMMAQPNFLPNHFFVTFESEVEFLKKFFNYNFN